MSIDTFHVDYGRLSEALIIIVVMAFLIERALSLIFEHRWYSNASGKGFKEVITVIVAGIVCWSVGFDAIAIIFQFSETRTVGGALITAFIVAGGSKASVGLFRDLLGFMSTAEKERQGK